MSPYPTGQESVAGDEKISECHWDAFDGFWPQVLMHRNLGARRIPELVPMGEVPLLGSDVEMTKREQARLALEDPDDWLPLDSCGCVGERMGSLDDPKPVLEGGMGREGNECLQRQTLAAGWDLISPDLQFSLTPKKGVGPSPCAWQNFPGHSLAQPVVQELM